MAKMHTLYITRKTQKENFHQSEKWSYLLSSRNWIKQDSVCQTQKFIKPKTIYGKIVAKMKTLLQNKKNPKIESWF